MSDFSRRSLVRGVAWSVPVVAVAVNAPAFAASFPPVKLTFEFGEKCSGNSSSFNPKTYIFQFQADSQPAQGSVDADVVTVNGEIFNVVRIRIIGTTVFLVTESSGNSANASGQGSVTYTSGMPEVTQTVTFTYQGTPPDKALCSRTDI